MDLVHTCTPPPFWRAASQPARAHGRSRLGLAKCPDYFSSPVFESATERDILISQICRLDIHVRLQQAYVCGFKLQQAPTVGCSFLARTSPLRAGGTFIDIPEILLSRCIKHNALFFVKCFRSSDSSPIGSLIVGRLFGQLLLVGGQAIPTPTRL